MSENNGQNGNGKPKRVIKTYPARVVAACIAMLCAGESVKDVSEKYDVPITTICEWKQTIPPEVGKPRAKREVIESLLGEYLEEILKMAIVQVREFQDVSWIRAQNASEIAVLHGTIVDKGLRILEAAEAAGQRVEQRQLSAANPDTAPSFIPESET